MAQFIDHIPDQFQDFIERQPIFFVASATADSRINLSPKGRDCLRVLDDRQIVYLDQTGSGNETAAHVRTDGRLTIMFCAFEGSPLILRLYGRGRVIPRGSAEYKDLLSGGFASQEPPGARQMIILDIESVQTSCGFAVPLMTYESDRTMLSEWATRQGPEGIDTYWRKRNAVSIDGIPTGMAEALDAN